MNDPQPPSIFLLPLAVPYSDSFEDLDPGVLSRRIPDFLQLILNQDEAGPIGMLEIHTPIDDGKIKWVTPEEAPDQQDAFSMIPSSERVSSIVAGTLTAEKDLLSITLLIHKADQAGYEAPEKLEADLPTAKPIPPLIGLAEQLAKALEIPFAAPEPGLLSDSGPAFFSFLDGLEGTAILNGDIAIAPLPDGELLMRPLNDSLALDPSFGISLRTLNAAITTALEQGRMDSPSLCSILDQCFRTQPSDGDGCVAVADNLASVGEEGRAQAWLEHACALDPPPPRALEFLGILFANRDETIAASNLWHRGLETDGHPDFCAHLARLAFSEGKDGDAWEKILRGLRRIRERSLRAGEWQPERSGPGVLLRYLVEHLPEAEPPEVVTEAIKDLCGLLTAGEDRIDLGLCLLAIGSKRRARVEIVTGLGDDPSPPVRDQALRALLIMDIPHFERRFAQAVDAIISDGKVSAAIADLEDFLERQPRFWPAQYFMGLAQRRLGNDNAAIDIMAEVLRLRPGQPDTLGELAQLFDERGNPKRALECIEEALDERPEEAQLLGQRARYLHRLGYREVALETVDRAIQIDPNEREFRKLRREIAG
ncbi:MAG: tetratricopeptide repeat protein [Planctomycetota bacterium]|nr:tetratricopeptide repeat protein [Planctomycetota bacterium]